MPMDAASRLAALAGTLDPSAMVPSTQVAGGGSIPAGLIVMWGGLLATIPAGWKLCDGSLGTPDLRGLFVKGAAAAANPGVTGGGAHTHATHVVTQPGAHASHVVTQPSAHAAHAALGTHAHELPFIKVAGATGQLRMLASSIFGTGTSRAPESVSAAPTALTTAAAVELSQAVSGGTPDAHSAHAGAAVDAHSAHAGTAVDAHSSVTGEPAYYSLAFIQKT